MSLQSKFGDFLANFFQVSISKGLHVVSTCDQIFKGYLNAISLAARHHPSSSIIPSKFEGVVDLLSKQKDRVLRLHAQNQGNFMQQLIPGSGDPWFAYEKFYDLSRLPRSLMTSALDYSVYCVIL